MLIGINAPSLIDRRMESAHGLLCDHLSELDVRSVRIPVVWAALDPDGTGELDDRAIARLEKAIDMLPVDARFLGCLLHPSQSVAEDYFHDPSSLSERFACFAGAIAARLPRITEWEVWNEPNASDFYLSVRDGAGARPWTAREFVEHVLLPGARAIRKVQPNARLCMGGVAEDGIVGHDGRQPALSNRMPRKPEYDTFRVPGPHGHFFFVRDYWDDLSQDLAERVEEVANLFDAYAFHPYPYFGIQQRPDKSLLPSTVGHTNAFLSRLDAAGLSDLEIWATEFGGRSLIVAGQHRDDEHQQAKYANAAFTWLAETGRIARAYWYKLVDMPWDLQQEKTFGLLDYRLMPRKAYYTVRSVARRQHAELPRTTLLETFQNGRLRCGHGLDPEAWTVTGDTIFGYMLGTAGEKGNGECLMVPGRAEGSNIRIESTLSLDPPQGRSVSVQLDLSLPFGDAPAEMEIAVAGDGEPDLRVGVGLDAACQISVAHGERRYEATPDLTSWPVAAASALSRVDLLWSGEGLNVELHFREIRLHRGFTIPAPAVGAPLKIAVTGRRLGARAVFLSLSRIEARLVSSLDLPQRPPKNGKGEDTWFLSLPRYSQIFQDDWVMQMLRFKRDGFFAEIGGHDGIENSNTLLLERLLGWRGMIVEANPRWHRAICANRTSIAYNNAAFSESGGSLEFVDAGAIGGLVDFLQKDVHADKRDAAIRKGCVIQVQGRRTDELLTSAGAPKVIDYMSVDTEGSEAEVLSGIDFSEWAVALITVEHGGVEENRQAVWERLEPHGFLRHRVWFEDWFWHPAHLAAALGTDEAEARAHADLVFFRERYHRQVRLMAEARRSRRTGDLAAAAELSEEAGKGFHPDNVHALAEAIESRAQLGQSERALNICDAALRAFPRNRRILRQCALRYTEAGRKGKLADVMNRIAHHTPDLLADESLAPLADAAH